MQFIEKIINYTSKNLERKLELKNVYNPSEQTHIHQHTKNI